MTTGAEGQDPNASQGGGGTGGTGGTGGEGGGTRAGAGSNAGAGAGTGAGGAGGQGGEGAEAGAGAGGAAGAGAGEGQGGGSNDKAGEGQQQFDAAYVKQLRDEAAANRKKAKDLETRLKAIEDANLSEADRATKRLKELEEENAALLAQTRRSEVHAAAARAGAAHPEVVARLVGEDVDDVAAEVEKLRKQYPVLFRTGHGSADGGTGTGNPPPSKKSMNQFIRTMAGRT